MVNRLPHETRATEWQFRGDFNSPVLAVAGDDTKLEFGPESEFGKLYGGLGFTVTDTLYTSSLQGVIDDPATTKALRGQEVVNR